MSIPQACNLKSGTVIQGKWNKNSYRIIKRLGFGATGVVYLAAGPNGKAAIKVSDNSTAIISEVNVLRQFAKVQGSILGPSLLDVDDWLSPSTNQIIHYYVMEYLEGESLFAFIERRGEEWIEVFLHQLLNDLQKLHENGWVFGDLKPDNVLIVSSPPKIRWLDVGGTTLQGRAIKEYTEFFDRGYWGLGSRKAEPSYDLFCVAMIIINVAYKKRFTRSGNGYEQLVRMIDQKPLLTEIKPILLKALEGKYPEAAAMKMDLLKIQTRSGKRRMQQVQAARKKVRVKQKAHKKAGILETFFLVLSVLIAYFVYIYTNLIAM
ncbi:MAG: protein kinase family protein [Ectobacillus sp.]